jgi:small subunit ribosomal protein S13
MPRLLGVDIPNNRSILIALTYLYGVGPAIARELCLKAEIDITLKAKDVSESDIAKLASLLDNAYVVEGQLRRQVNQNSARLREIGCYRGIRHRKGLPVRGQRTKTNARTRKGPKKTVAGKKGVKDLREQHVRNKDILPSGRFETAIHHQNSFGVRIKGTLLWQKLLKQRRKSKEVYRPALSISRHRSITRL